MPIQAQKINPLDLQPRKAVGISLPFSAASVFNSTFETKDAVKTNLINYLLTETGERYFNPFFGTGLRKQLFENINQEKVEFLYDTLSEGIRLNFPRIVINNLQVEGIPDTNTILFTLKYSIRDTNITDQQITIALEQ
jgi:phage baseplate assembly protein W